MAAIDHCLHYLHIAAGVSYYKAFIPPRIKVETQPLSQIAAQFFNRFYLKGLGEFAYRNNIDLRNRIRFPYRTDSNAHPAQLSLPRRTAVPVGGGKDSSVTLELLKRHNEPMTALSVGYHKSIEEIASAAEIPLWHVKRYLSPNLLELNKNGALNGHVPITGILSFVFVVAAIVYGFDTIAMSNEGSANVGNVKFEGLEVNHQWSKSEEFEIEFRELLRSEIFPSLQYFSLLRPFSELFIAKIFSNFTHYHRRFSSCNKAFKIEGKIDAKWCGDCDKCRFVFLILSPFLSHKSMMDIFRTNLLAQKTQLPKFEKLLGLKGAKPFECVGEFEESIAALTLLGRLPEWQNSEIVNSLLSHVNASPATADGYINTALSIKHTPWMPDRYKGILNAVAGLTGEKGGDLGRR